MSEPREQKTTVTAKNQYTVDGVISHVDVTRIIMFSVIAKYSGDTSVDSLHIPCGDHMVTLNFLLTVYYAVCDNLKCFLCKLRGYVPLC